MNTFTTILAQATTYSSDFDPANEVFAGLVGVLAVFIVLLPIILFFALALYIVNAIFTAKIFEKAGVPAWVAWVPVYNNWKLLEIGGQNGWWILFSLIPGIGGLISTVFLYIAMFHIGKKLGKEDTFVVLGIFLPIVWLIWLAVDKSTWNDAASTAPSLHKA